MLMRQRIKMLFIIPAGGLFESGENEVENNNQQLLNIHV